VNRPPPNATEGAAWSAQPERSSAFWLGLLVWIALHLGRAPARLLLWPIALFFLLTGGVARRASRDYLGRVLGRMPRAGEVLCHFHCFAACTLDRLLLLGGCGAQLQIRGEIPEAVMQPARSGKGCIMLVSHLGSFEMLRRLGQDGHGIPLRIVLDRSQGPLLTGLLERIDPQFAASIIDAAQRGPELALALRDALGRGDSIGLMADRVRPGEASVPVRFLGGQARLPTAPWLLAAVLQVPVIAAFGIYRGGRDYEVAFELLATRIEAPRGQRQPLIQAWAQAYAERMEQQLHDAPYNWFNFYPYWTDAGTDETSCD
jgi:predicted LPLAT superfamily acyltransferase